MTTTEDRLAEQAWRQAEERFRATFDRAAVGMVHVDVEGRIIEVNPALEAMLGYDKESLLGAQLHDLAQDEDWSTSHGLFEELLGGARDQYKVELRYLRSDGTLLWADLTMSALRDLQGHFSFAIGVLEDTTDRKAREVELRHSQRLESMGGLAAGIAHELNTPIQFIGDNVRFLAESIEAMLRLICTYRDAVGPDAPPMSWTERQALLAEAEVDAEVSYLTEEMPLAIRQSLDGVQRVATIVQAMKAFAHPSRDEQAATDLNQALRDTLIVAQSELKGVADVVTELGELPSVVCYRGDLNQVFLNLLVNAAHAVADTGKRGKVTVRSRQEGDHAVVEVADTGTGIPEVIREKIFEPFFTTKPVGRGTGQGLALAHGVVTERHGGSIEVQSEVGQGTTFVLRLPVRGVAGRSAGTDRA